MFSKLNKKRKSNSISNSFHCLNYKITEVYFIYGVRWSSGKTKGHSYPVDKKKGSPVV